jgi:carboxyl-terminal processing protease
MTPRLRLLAPLVAVLATGCAAIDPNGLLTRQLGAASAEGNSPVPSAGAARLDEATRAAAFDYVWRTIDERYYDPKMNGVDWKAVGERWKPQVLGAPDDDAFWDRLDRMTGELRDSHTRVESPQRARLMEQSQSVSLGFAFRPMGDDLVVTSVNPESDAWWAGVRAGMSLATVNGEPAGAAFAKLLAEARESSSAHAKNLMAARRLLAGEPDSTATLAFRRGDGTLIEAKLRRTRFTYPPRVTHRRLPGGPGYIRLTSWSQSLQGGMIEAIRALKDAPSLVIDLRGNPGGSGLMVRNVAAQFFSGEVKAGRALTRTGRPITLAFDLIEVIKLEQVIEGKGLYAGPVAVLIDGDSGSGSEMFAAILQSQKRARIVGQVSCGCLLAYMGYAAVPGGGRLAYSEVGFVLPDGQRVEGTGVIPDVPVPVSSQDLAVNRDRALETAVAELAKLPAPPPAKAAAK